MSEYLDVTYYNQRPNVVGFKWIARDVNGEFHGGAYDPPVRATRDIAKTEVWDPAPGCRNPLFGPGVDGGKVELDAYLGMCNITCLAMLLEWLGYLPAGSGPKRILDDLYSRENWEFYKTLAAGYPYFKAFRLVEDPTNMKKIATELYDVAPDSFTSMTLGTSSPNAFFTKAKADYLDRGVPLIIICGLYRQTQPGSAATEWWKTSKGGHYALLVGVTDTDVYIYDPWGDPSSRNQGTWGGYGGTELSAPTRFSRSTFAQLIENDPLVVVIDTPPVAEGETVEVVQYEQPSLGPKVSLTGKKQLYKLLPHLSVEDFRQLVDHYRENIDTLIELETYPGRGPRDTPSIYYPDNPRARRIRPLSQGFGYTPWKELYTKSGPPRYHMGIDFGLAEGTQLAAAHGGVVHDVVIVEEGYAQLEAKGFPAGTGYGTCVVLWDRENQLVSFYGHMKPDSVTVERGEVIEPGHIIGLSGNTGFSIGAHLHFDLRKTLPVPKDQYLDYGTLTDATPGTAGYTTPGGTYRSPYPPYDNGDDDRSDDHDHIGKYLNPLGSLVEWYYELTGDPQISYPFQTSQEPESPLLYYLRAESAGGGYYPAGLSRSLHGGIHLYPDMDMHDVLGAVQQQDLTVEAGTKVPVRCMAPGFVIAARLEPQTTGDDDEALRGFLNSYTGFVLIRHEIALGDSEEKTYKPFYSLYMHLSPEDLPDDPDAFTVDDTDYGTIAWVRRLIFERHPSVVKLQSPERSGTVYETFHTKEEVPSVAQLGTLAVHGRRPIETSQTAKTGSGQEEVKTAFLRSTPSDVREALAELPKGTLVTFSEPLVPVKAGDVLGHVCAEQGKSQGFLHWEVFFAEGDDTLDALLSAAGELDGVEPDLFKPFEDSEKNDNYMQRAELETLYQLYASRDADGAEEDASETLGALLETLPPDGEGKDAAQIEEFRSKLIELITGRGFSYKVTLALDEEELAVDAAFDGEALTVEFLEAGEVDPMTLGSSEAAQRVQDSIAGLTVGDLRGDGKVIFVPLEAQRIRLSSRVFDLEVEAAGTPGEFFSGVAGQRLRNLHFKHTSDWTPEALSSLLDTLAEAGFISAESKEDTFRALYPLTWWNRPRRGQNGPHGEADAFGEVPVVGEAGEEVSLFGSVLDPAAKIQNLHPVTATWLLQLLFDARKLTFRDTWGGAAEAEGDNPAKDYAWYFPDGSNLTLAPRVGQLGYLIVVGQTAYKGSGQAVEATGETGTLRLADVAFDTEGVFAKPVEPCLWGTWSLPSVDSDQSNNTLTTITLARPVIHGIASRLTTREVADAHDQAEPVSAEFLLTSVHFEMDEDAAPDLLEGLLFFRTRRYTPVAGREASAEDVPWEDVDRALPVRGRRGEGRCCLTLEADLRGVRDAIKPDDLAEGEVCEVKAGFFCPNGGLLALDSPVAPGDVAANTPITIGLDAFLDQVGRQNVLFEDAEEGSEFDADALFKLVNNELLWVVVDATGGHPFYQEPGGARALRDCLHPYRLLREVPGCTRQSGTSFEAPGNWFECEDLETGTSGWFHDGWATRVASKEFFTNDVALSVWVTPTEGASATSAEEPNRIKRLRAGSYFQKLEEGPSRPYANKEGTWFRVKYRELWNRAAEGEAWVHGGYLKEAGGTA